MTARYRNRTRQRRHYSKIVKHRNRTRQRRRQSKIVKQEEEKVERKRERNRIAATKCRKRKIERINILEEEVKMLNEKMSEHMNTKRKLQIEIDELRNRIRAHVKQGCKNLEE